MKVCSLRASARAAARLRRGVRRGVARRLDARLRRPSRPALSRLARDELRPGAVGVGPRLVGGLSGAAVLSARVRVPRRAPRVADHGRSRRRDGLPGAALARLSPARSHDVRRARAADRPALASAVDGGVRTGMVGARLAWALLPSLLGFLARWAEDERPLSPAVPLLLAAVTLLHPAQLPAAVALVVLAACARGPWWQRARGALRALILAAALTAFWTLPL